MVVQPSQCAVQQVHELVRRAIHRLFNVCGVLGHNHRLPAFEAGLQQATMVVLTTLGTVLVTQMNFQAGDVLAEALEGILDAWR